MFISFQNSIAPKHGKENHSILNGSLIRDSKAWETRVTCCVAPVGLSSPNLNITFGSAVAKRAHKGHVALPRHRLGMSTEPRIISNSRWYWVQLMLPRVYHWILRLRLAWISMEFYIIIIYHHFIVYPYIIISVRLLDVGFWCMLITFAQCLPTLLSKALLSQDLELVRLGLALAGGSPWRSKGRSKPKCSVAQPRIPRIILNHIKSLT